jgi:tRNA1(Val) A37 N6-methylase TrmN6
VRRALTDGYLLDGRVRYAQPRHGFRSGIEPVLLAAAIPATPGSRVLEGGSGAGATLLCLAGRVAGVVGLGIEQDLFLAALARQNAAANGWSDLTFVAADLTAAKLADAFDHACANPPYHAMTGTPSADLARRAAKSAAPGQLAAWAGALAGPLRARGTLTFILPAAVLADAIEAFARAGCAPTAILPLWPKPGQPAKLLLLRGAKGSRAPLRLLSGLTLHAPDGHFTEEAQSILRGGAALTL